MTRIKDFPIKTAAGDSDYFIFDGNNGTSIISLANLKSQISGGSSSGSTGGTSGGTSTSSGQDYITEKGTSGEWYYRKWASGYKECWIPGTEKTVNITNLPYNLSFTLPFHFSQGSNDGRGPVWFITGGFTDVSNHTNAVGTSVGAGGNTSGGVSIIDLNVGFATGNRTIRYAALVVGY